MPDIAEDARAQGWRDGVTDTLRELERRRCFTTMRAQREVTRLRERLGDPSDMVPSPMTAEHAGEVNDYLRIAGDNLAEATRLLGEMSDRAKIDKRRDDVYELARQTAALSNAGDVIARHLT